MNIEAMQVEHDRITAYLREHALEKANKDPEFRKAHITHCILTELLMPGPLSPANLATAQKQLRQIEDGTHPDLLR